MSRSIVPELSFKDLPVSAPSARRAKGTLTGIASVLLHALSLAALLVVPLLSDDRLPDQAGQVQAFFASPLELAPPPPPPPPAAASPAVTRAPQPVRTGGFVAPVEVPTEIVPEAGLDLGIEGGLAGGVEGGVPGGVVGGVVGGLPDAPPPPPQQAVRVGGQIKEPKKLKAVAPVYPDIAKQARVQGVVILECTISPQGKVNDVKILRGIPLLDQAAVEAVRQWVYTPTLLNGVPVPVIMTVTVNFKLS